MGGTYIALKYWGGVGGSIMMYRL